MHNNRLYINERFDFICKYNIILNIIFKKKIKNLAFYRLTDSFVRLVCDALYSVLCFKIVDGFGFPNKLILSVNYKIKQYYKFKSYYHDSFSNTFFGMHIGVDFVKSDGFYYPVDINLDAAIRNERRLLYNTEYDPILVGLIDLCKSKKISQIFLYAKYWTNLYINEVENLNKSSSIQFIVASPNYHSDVRVQHFCYVPDNFEKATLCVIFNHLPTPLDYYMTNQSCTSHWLSDECRKVKNTYIKPVEASDQLSRLVLEFDKKYPNLVIKLGGGSSGQYVKIAQVDKYYISKYLNKNIISIFHLNLKSRLKNLIGQHNKIIFQKFVPSDTINGHAQIIRAHILVAPFMSKLLSCHRVVSDFKIPDSLPIGVVEDDRPFVVNFSKGARYEKVSSDEELEVSLVVDELAKIIDSAVRNKFLV